MPSQVRELQGLPVRHKAVCGKDRMAEAVLKAYGA